MVIGSQFLLGSCSPFKAGRSQVHPDPGRRLGGNTQQTCSLHGAQWGPGRAALYGTSPRVSWIVSFSKRLPVGERESPDGRNTVCSRLCPRQFGPVGYPRSNASNLKQDSVGKPKPRASVRWLSSWQQCRDPFWVCSPPEKEPQGRGRGDDLLTA